MSLGEFSFREVSSQIRTMDEKRTGVGARIHAWFATIKQFVGIGSSSATRALQALSEEKPTVIGDEKSLQGRLGPAVEHFDDDDEELVFYDGELINDGKLIRPEAQGALRAEDIDQSPSAQQTDQPEAGETPPPEEGLSPSPGEDSPFSGSSLPEDQGAPEAPSSSPKAPAPDSLAGLSSSSAKAPLADRTPKGQPGDTNPAAGGESLQSGFEDLFRPIKGHFKPISRPQPAAAAIPPRPESGNAGKAAAGKPRLSQAELRKMFQQAMHIKEDVSASDAGIGSKGP
ncbi:MAG: hypothetical protein LBD54_00550 [Puniceicoccales bacterium]|jgi:hypothetical protein|nr:hypothetical protein [Puniceicoccales bacterium]